MDGIIDTDLTMVADNAFSNVLRCVQNSGLNYHIQMSPFSANISLKKSLVRTLSGTPILPKPSEKADNIIKQESELLELRNEYEDIAQKLQAAYKTMVGWLVVGGAVRRVFPCATFEIKSES